MSSGVVKALYGGSKSSHLYAHIISLIVAINQQPKHKHLYIKFIHKDITIYLLLVYVVFL